MAQLPKGGLVRGHDKPIHGSSAIYFPGGNDMSCHGFVAVAHFILSMPTPTCEGSKGLQKRTCC